MRWLATSLRWQAKPSGDIIVFAVFHEPTRGVALDRSTALDKGLVAVANLFADPEAQATNEIVLAHELLHTLRATDKYSLTTNAPSYPDGYAAPDARPLLPQDEGGAHGRPHCARRAARRDAERSPRGRHRGRHGTRDRLADSPLAMTP
jgi:hypothetical protein